MIAEVELRNRIVDVYIRKSRSRTRSRHMHMHLFITRDKSLLTKLEQRIRPLRRMDTMQDFSKLTFIKDRESEREVIAK